MKKLFAIVAMAAVCTFGTTSVLAQEAAPAATEQTTDSAAVDTAATAAVDTAAAAVDTAAVAADEAAPVVEEEEGGVYKVAKDYFIDGGAIFMAFVALSLVFGLALCIERIIYLSLAQINMRQFVASLAEKVGAGKEKEALEFANSARGPVAQVSKKALACLNSEDMNDINTIERSINMEAEVQGAYLEENCSWITLFIAMAPSLGFLGTVIGMVEAFNDIERAGDISPTVVASGMKVALITTIFGIVVALVLQIFYNYILSRIESLTSNMEETAQELLVMCVKSDKCKK